MKQIKGKKPIVNEYIGIHLQRDFRSVEAQTYRTLYSTKNWKTLRRQALTRDEYRCQHSGCGAHLQAGRDHPRSAVVHHLKPHAGGHERRQLAVIRSMSFNQTTYDPRALNGFAKLETKARSAIAKVGAHDLIARP